MDTVTIGDPRMTPEYAEARRGAWAVIVVYGVIVPCAYAALLFSVRGAVQTGQPTPLSKALAFLHHGYHPCFNFTRKLVIQSWTRVARNSFLFKSKKQGAQHQAGISWWYRVYHVFNPWVLQIKGQVGIREFFLRLRLLPL